MTSVFPKYVVICSVRNEERYIRPTLSSVVSQTMHPAEMIVVDDSSKDSTPEIVKYFQSNNPWLKLIHVHDGGSRELGGRVVRNFYLGLKHVTAEYEFIVKMDGDVSFPPNYFEYLLYKFSEDKQLGMAGGAGRTPLYGDLRVEKSSPPYDVPGPLKMYRKKCFKDIGGLIPMLGWDHIDQMKARMKGWKTQHFGELQIIHHRPMGSSIGSLSKGKMRWGETAYIVRMDPFFVLAKGIYHIFQIPYVTGGISFWIGYITSVLKRKVRFSDLSVCKYYRRQQRRRLLGKKVDPPMIKD